MFLRKFFLISVLTAALLVASTNAASAQAEDSIFLVTGWMVGDTTLVVGGELRGAPNTEYGLRLWLTSDCDGPRPGEPLFISIRTNSDRIAVFTKSFAVEVGGSLLLAEFGTNEFWISRTRNNAFRVVNSSCQPVRRQLTGPAPSDDEDVTSEAERLAWVVEQIIKADPLQSARLVEGAVAGGNADAMVEVLEVMDPQSAGMMIDVMDVSVAAALWGVMDAKRAGAVMDAIITERATEIVNLVPEPNLLERLPYVTPHCLWAMPLDLLIQKMPSAPVMHLDFWVRPEPAPERASPIATPLSDTATEYGIARTVAGEWSTLVGSPVGIDRILARFARPRQDVTVFIERLGLDPAVVQSELPAFPSGRIVNAFFKIEVNNVEPEDVLAIAAMFSVEKSWIDANRIHMWSLEFSRLDETTSTWLPHPSKRIGEDAERINFVAVLPGFSTLAITGAEQIPESTFEVTDLVIEPSQPVVGEEVTISAIVTNTGTGLGTYPSTLWIDHEIERHLSVVVRPGESAPVSFTVTRPAGTYKTRVEKLLAGFTVSSAVDDQLPTPTATEDDRGGAAEQSSPNPPSVGGLSPSANTVFSGAVAALTLIVWGSYITLVGIRRKRTHSA